MKGLKLVLQVLPPTLQTLKLRCQRPVSPWYLILSELLDRQDVLAH